MEGFLIFINMLHMETVVFAAAIYAELFAAGESDPVGAGGFTAALTDIGIKNACLFGECDGGFLDCKQIFLLAGVVVVKGLFP